MKKFLKNFIEDFIKYPLYLMAHPIQGFDDFKRENLGKAKVAFTFIIISSFYPVFAYNGLGFHINGNDPAKFNAVLLFLTIFAPVILLAVGNWSVTVLFNGKGTLLDIIKLFGYALFPFMICSYVGIILSNFLALDEMGIYNLVMIGGALLLVYNVFFGLMGIHEYSVSKTIATIGLTIVSVAIILFCCLLLLTVFQRVIDTVLSIYNEIIQRYF